MQVLLLVDPGHKRSSLKVAYKKLYLLLYLLTQIHIFLREVSKFFQKIWLENFLAPYPTDTFDFNVTICLTFSIQ